MKKIVLFSLIALGLAAVVTQARQQTPTVLVGAPDIPPPSCGPDNCQQ